MYTEQRHRAVRAIYFYNEICSELDWFASVRKDAGCWLLPGQLHTYGDLYRQWQTISGMRKRTEAEASQKLENLKTLVSAILRFYRQSYPLSAPMSHITNWRWWHIQKWAERWIEIARSHDWADYLEIEPTLHEEPWWSGPYIGAS